MLDFTLNVGQTESNVANKVYTNAGDPETMCSRGRKPDLLSAALVYARRGVPVFPLAAGDKIPRRGSRGFYDATTDPGKIREWWGHSPESNIGIPTGEASGILALDVDGDRDGFGSLEALEAAHGKLPATATVRTGGGGIHYLYRYPVGEKIKNSADQLAPGLDIRGSGGYIVAPPSRTTGPYETLERHALADPPAWLLESLRDPESEAPEISKDSFKNGTMCADLDGPEISAGGRNAGLTRSAGRLRARGATDAELLEELERINDARCSPPLTAREVHTIARSASRWKIGTSRPGPDPENVAELERVAAGVEAGDWRGMGARSARDVMVSLIKAGRVHGEKIPAGVRVSISVRALALAAAVSLPTAQKAIRRLREAGYIRRDDRDRTGTNAGALVLVGSAETPRANLTHSTTYREAIEPHSELVCNPCAPPAHPYSAPRLRWSAPTYHRERGEIVRETVYRLGKTAGAVIDALEAAGGTLTLEEIAAALGVSRPRDLRRRAVSRLEASAVVECDADTVSLAVDWTAALEDERERGGEIAALRRDMARYARESEAYRRTRSGQSPQSREDRPHAPPPEYEAPDPDGYVEDLERLSRPPETLPGSETPGALGGDGEIICDPWRVLELARERFGTAYAA